MSATQPRKLLCKPTAHEEHRWGSGSYWCPGVPGEHPGTDPTEGAPAMSSSSTSDAIVVQVEQAVADAIYRGDTTMPGAALVADLLHERGLLATTPALPTREQIAFEILTAQHSAESADFFRFEGASPWRLTLDAADAILALFGAQES